MLLFQCCNLLLQILLIFPNLFGFRLSFLVFILAILCYSLNFAFERLFFLIELFLFVFQNLCQFFIPFDYRVVSINQLRLAFRFKFLYFAEFLA